MRFIFHSFPTPPNAPPARPNPSSRFGLAALIAGGVSLLVAWVPYWGMLMIPLAMVGAVVAIIGIVVGRMAHQRKLPIPAAGFLLCGFSIGVSLLSTRLWEDRDSAAGRGTPTQPQDVRPAPGPIPRPPTVTNPTFIVPKIESLTGEEGEAAGGEADR
jgi:hypothetical protein